MSTTVDRTRFPLEDYADELRAAPENTKVGHQVFFENDRVRVWGIDLAPGERVPFHCHERTYFWVCTDGARGNQRFPTGEQASTNRRPHLQKLSPARPAVFHRPTSDAILPFDVASWSGQIA